MLQIYLLLCKATSYQYKKALQNQNASHYVFIQSFLAGFSPGILYSVCIW